MTTKEYRKENFKQLKQISKDFLPKIKLVDSIGNATKWMDLTWEEVEKIKVILTK